MRKVIENFKEKTGGGAFDLVGMEREVASEAIIIINKGMHTQTW
jgi:hypothetical protein